MGLDLTGLGTLGQAIKGLVERFVPVPLDQNQQQQMLGAIKMAEENGDLQKALGQMAINQEEAKSPSLFIAGWRPYIGWVGGAGITYKFLVFPIFGAWLGMHDIDIASLIALVSGMLGLGMLRTYEKAQGVEGNR